MLAQRRLLSKALALILAASACRLASRGGAGHAFAPPVATLAAPARAVAGRAGAQRDADAMLLEDVLRGAEAAADALRGAEAAARGRRSSDLEPRLESGGKFAEAVPETALNPPWATCYVEAQLTTKSVIEEWVMRGESEVIESFSAWRRSSEGAGNIKCVDISTEDALQSECLECALTFDLSAEGTLSFVTGPSDCMESAARGHGFCKSGELLLG
ncbi:unnamed protein product [Prorocentrum cordatum]|uniref:Uncharacterized protein n=1 Tax=Prorocentrum cordatum TaxID=2364126 RepID=A0ABN9WMD7_9DINO|nr:unnamed protein product [Polarella glacialis]